MSALAERRNTATGLVLVAVVAGMVGLAFAAVPLYRLFCQVTGYGGTTQRAETAPAQIGDRIITVRFNADVNSALPWDFVPVQREVEVRVGEETLVFYRAENRSSEPITGTAVFNVTPLKAGVYFSKIACFCFEEQRLAAGQAVDMPISFFVDPAIADDPNLDDVKTITLSYTFFPVREEAADGIQERKTAQAAD
ncbi:MAG: cytochrome c oxidase assembly protein [Alphaproteobacteria bacterium]|nr:cytochrome c oxidase assembly protein [Alphaproteobacteria bacterium]